MILNYTLYKNVPNPSIGMPLKSYMHVVLQIQQEAKGGKRKEGEREINFQNSSEVWHISKDKTPNHLLLDVLLVTLSCYFYQEVDERRMNVSEKRGR